MTAELPSLSREQFDQRLGHYPHGATLSAEGLERLWLFYEELRRWSTRLALVGPGTAQEAVERHFGESLAALPLLPERGRLLDLGSGGGFPGLALAATTPLRCTLVEARLRKTAFLRAAARRMGVRAEILEERIGEPLSSRLPRDIDCLTARAVRFSEPLWESLCGLLAPGATALVWAGAERPPLRELELVAETPLPRSQRRRILQYRKP